jgi:aryl-alcohol dehydrogenase-like predicted oxidoreductase
VPIGTAPQLALAWVLANGDDLIPIPGTKKKHYLEENLAALDIVLPEDGKFLDEPYIHRQIVSLKSRRSSSVIIGIQMICRRHLSGKSIHPISALQSEYSLWSREAEEHVLPACRELGISFVPYSPLGRGFLSGKMTSTDHLDADDYRRRIPCSIKNIPIEARKSGECGRRA